MKEETVSKEKVYGKHQLMTPIPIMHCPGCHYGTIIRLICEVIDELGIEDRAIGLAGVGCSFAWPMYLDIDMTSCPHGRAPAMATAIKRLQPDTVVFTCQGDGDLGAIGLGCFMNSLLRGEKLTTIFLNNAVYGTTGGQMAPTTLLEMRTTTTPYGRDTEKTGFPLHAAELVATMKGVAFSARCALNSPNNYNKARKAVKTAFLKQIQGIGYGFVEFLSACPPNWGLTPVDALDFISEKMIAEYPLGEFKDVESI